MVKIVSLGGSIVAPDGVDAEFVRSFVDEVRSYLGEDDRRRLILIVGGGAPARRYQEAYRVLTGGECSEDQDWVGIMATRLNAELVRAVFHHEGLCDDPVVTDPTAPEVRFSGRVLVGAGWKPGFSTDFDAVKLAERYSADTVINLSNIEQVYTADPRIDADAVPLSSISWKDFTALVGEDWKPGSNLPFDPVATKQARQLGLKVVAAGGRDLANIGKILRDQEFFGTKIGG
ncbi:UMP kinase [Spirochaeta lutea]|uniref:Uridylate kinase n=1 Tax=Spirochaeta lutea TaxID=1480694 RepID=A0A098QVK4_9SPIO|nr:UMP kinase [Spirochaeta lutea]KGE71616.1 uridylate kinase [Spirochaeta lutea]